MSQEETQQQQEAVAAPFHVLMTCSPSRRSLQELLVTHDAIKNDYLARRFRALNDGEEREECMWSAASPIECAMLECCHLESSDEQTTMIVGGSLTRGKEQDFVQLLAMHCHTAASRGLALAILEKTMQQDKLEAPTVLENVNDEAMVEENDVAPIIKSEHEDNTATNSVKQECDQQDDIPVPLIGRMSQFLKAGGLQILKQWLLDATTPIQIYVTKPPPSPPQQQPQPQQSSTKKQAATRVLETTASPTGPLLLPLLSILTDMPLDKQLVVDLKVNRCIKKLKKQLDQAIASRRAQRIDDQQWTDPVAGGLIVEQVNTAISKLMNKWGQQTKSSTPLTTTLDPFQSLQSKMEQRLELLKKYEMGDIEKPSFLAKFEEQERLQKEQEEMSKLTTEQRAAREREQEKQQMLKTAKKRQEQAKARKEMLLKKNKEARMKQKAEGAPLDGNEKRIRRVRWKDGFDNADHVRRRNLLEQVHVYTEEICVDDYDDNVEQEEESMMKEDPEDGDGIPFADTDDGAPVKQDPDDEDDSIP